MTASLGCQVADSLAPYHKVILLNVVKLRKTSIFAHEMDSNFSMRIILLNLSSPVALL